MPRITNFFADILTDNKYPILSCTTNIPHCTANIPQYRKSFFRVAHIKIKMSILCKLHVKKPWLDVDYMLKCIDKSVKYRKTPCVFKSTNLGAWRKIQDWGNHVIINNSFNKNVYFFHSRTKPTFYVKVFAQLLYMIFVSPFPLSKDKLDLIIKKN